MESNKSKETEQYIDRTARYWQWYQRYRFDVLLNQHIEQFKREIAVQWCKDNPIQYELDSDLS